MCTRILLILIINYTCLLGYVSAAPNVDSSGSTIIQNSDNLSGGQYLNAKVNLRGWNYLAGRMIDRGAEAGQIIKIFSNPTFPQRETVFFKVKPQESKASYKGHNTPKARANALNFYKEQRRYFVKAEQSYHVPRSIILAILQVESQCGKFTGNHPVFYRLARLASMADPENLLANQKQYRKLEPHVRPQAVADRAKWLEETFLPHTLATLKLAEHKGKQPMALKGSIAGAIGLPQFLPGNVFKHGVDGDGDGIVNLYSPADAIMSVAKFLADHGWEKNTNSWKARSQILLHYNRSEPYVNTVLTMAGHLATSLK